MSLGGPISWPSACSGEMKPGEPKSRPGSGFAHGPWEIPKSITLGPSWASSTFDGFRSPCTTPAAWMALRPSASPAASASTVLTGSGPWPRTAWLSDGPET